jgi:23S rRNA (guanosine2251-2'-O)-methyltransferase
MKDKNIIYGLHAVKQHLNRRKSSLELLYVQKGKELLDSFSFLVETAKESGISVEVKQKSELDKISNKGVHQGIIAICSRDLSLFEEGDLEDLVDEIVGVPLVLVLDCVQDPHNFGACIRSADAVGVDLIIFPKDKSSPITSVVHKVSTGASGVVNMVSVTNLARSIRTLKKKGIWVIGLAGEVDDTTIFDMTLSDPVALVLGSEGSGLRRNTKNNCDYLVKLPMLGSVSSLNVSVAAGVSLYEVLRQRQAKIN